MTFSKLYIYVPLLKLEDLEGFPFLLRATFHTQCMEGTFLDEGHLLDSFQKGISSFPFHTALNYTHLG